MESPSSEKMSIEGKGLNTLMECVSRGNKNMASLQNMSAEDLPNVCGTKLKRIDGHCQNKPGEDWKCWRHRRQFDHNDDEWLSVMVNYRLTKPSRNCDKLAGKGT